MPPAHEDGAPTGSLFLVYAYDSSLAASDPTKFIIGAYASRQEAFARQAAFTNAMGGGAAVDGVSRAASGHVVFVNEVPFGRGCYVELFTRRVVS